MECELVSHDFLAGCRDASEVRQGLTRLVHWGVKVVRDEFSLLSGV